MIFTSDHGFHLGEHDFWAKVVSDESAKVPLIISVPQKPAICHSFVELLDLYPTLSACAVCPNRAGCRGRTSPNARRPQPSGTREVFRGPDENGILTSEQGVGLHSIW